MLSDDKLRAAVSVARDLDDSQLAWLSGYFAGLRQGAPTASASAREQPRATILHGSETGNARALAEKTASEWAQAGLAARVLPMSEYKTAQLARERVLLAIVSTHGEGDPPEPARGFFDFAFGKRAPKLDQTKFAVLALGDSSYEHFCRAGIDLDAQFEKLGASRLAPRVDCDVDFDAAAQKWRQQISAKISANGAVNGVAPVSLSVVAAPATDVFSRENPATATTVETVLLTAADESRQTWHIELQTPEALVFAPGDSLGVWPQNQPRLVARVAAALGFTGDEEVSLDGETASASEWLSNRLDLARVPPRALLAYGQTRAAGAGERKRGRRFPSGFEAAQRAASGRDWCDILRAYPPVKSNAQAVLASMRRIAPRLYSLANDRETRPGEAHLLVSVSSYDGADGARRGGLCSSFLAGLRADEPARVYAQAAPQFHLPESGSPVVMIGAGTGVAPFRSFLEARESRGGKNWLVFGERRRRDDFFYQREMLAWKKSGNLERLSVAFSRDGARKVYVQDRLREEAARLRLWILEGGAAIYVCGDERKMARDVDGALAEIFAPEGGSSFLSTLRRERRYCRDVY